MDLAEVLVVGETPSLGRSIWELLESGGIRTEYVDDLSGTEATQGGRPYPVIVAACNGYYCETARRWLSGERAGAALIVVGSRDARLAASRDLYLVPLPLDAARFLRLVATLLEDPRAGTPRRAL